MNEQEMHLNIRIDLSVEVWNSVIPEIYKAMDGWLDFAEEEHIKGLPFWFSFNRKEKHILASVEPGGIHFSGLIEDGEWDNWRKKIKRIATEKLGYKVGEIELGEVEE